MEQQTEVQPANIPKTRKSRTPKPKPKNPLLGKRLTIPTENQEQRLLVKWLGSHPVVKNYFLKVNNEGFRTLAQGMHLKLMGMKAGVSDLFIFYPTKSHHGLWIEMKRKRKYAPSELKTETWVAQEMFLELVKSVGFEGKICYGSEDAKKVIDEYLNA